MIWHYLYVVVKIKLMLASSIIKIVKIVELKYIILKELLLVDINGKLKELKN